MLKKRKYALGLIPFNLPRFETNLDQFIPEHRRSLITRVEETPDMPEPLFRQLVPHLRLVV